MLNLAITYTDSSSAVTQMSAARPRHLHAEFIGGEEGITSMTLSSETRVEEAIDITFVPACIPANPFYVRWINRNGGYDYRMFDGAGTDNYSVDEGESFEPYRRETSQVGEYRSRVSFESRKVVDVAATGLTETAFASVAAILTSPKVEWYDISQRIFKEITLDESTTLSWPRGASTADAALRFRMPGPNTQQ